MSTKITHTLNVVEKARRFSVKRDVVVTKYVIKVCLGVAGDRPRLEWQVARRYSHFRANHNALVGMFSAHRLPRLPPKQLLLKCGSGLAGSS